MEGKMMEPIKLTETLRVNDYDAQQYTIEVRTVVETSKKPENIGKVIWTPIAYCGSVKHLADRARERVGDEFAKMARKKAEEKFDEMGLGELLAALPPKGKAA